ncbi:hypothetical protein BH10ACT10_BH10ACT10_19590 [soil metagenome]
MRNDWVPLSASALVIGAMAMVFGSLLNPSQAGSSTAETLRVVDEDSARWLAMAVMYFFASISLTLGLPSVLTLFTRKGRKLGLTALAVFSIGAIGTCGYAMLLVFFRAMVKEGAVKSAAFGHVTEDKGLTAFLQGWIGCFYGGIVLLAVALLVAGSVPRWVPALLVAFVVMLPVAPHLGRVGGAVQILALAVAFTGVAMSAVTVEHSRELTRQPAF